MLAMKRVTITIPDNLAEALDAYRDDQEVAPALTAVVQAALGDFLAERGYFTPRRSLRITPAATGSGARDVSVEHDRYLSST
jgi:hypothetical protein